MGTYSNRPVSLDDLLYGEAGTIDIGTSDKSISEAKRISANTSDKAYRKLTASGNVTSYSKLASLHKCPRAYELDQLDANSPFATEPATVNLDFAFGHAVGAGIQTYAATRSLVSAQFAAFLAWKAPWDAEKTDAKGNPKGKSLTWAELAVEKFGWFYQKELSDFDVVTLPNGNPATELSFAIDMENGFYHFGHIDTLLQSKSTGKLAVWEGKTTGFETVDEALYANSSQALSYSVVVDAISKQLNCSGTDYEVLYVVYSSATRDFQLLPFGKSRTQRAEWLQDVLLDHAAIKQYEQLKFYPKRGDSCFNSKFNQRCKHFGTCTMSNAALHPQTEVKMLTTIEDVEAVDFKFTLSELIAAQKG